MHVFLPWEVGEVSCTRKMVPVREGRAKVVTPLTATPDSNHARAEKGVGEGGRGKKKGRKEGKGGRGKEGRKEVKEKQL